MFSYLPKMCVRSQYVIGISSCDLDGTVHVQKGACGLLWITALKEKLHIETYEGFLMQYIIKTWGVQQPFSTTFHHQKPVIWTRSVMGLSLLKWAYKSCNGRDMIWWTLVELVGNRDKFKEGCK